MGRLLNSYLALGVQPGSPLTVALRRYRWLAQAFHPDRFVESKRVAAEQEMRRLNDARDILRTHFTLKHRSVAESCQCESWIEPSETHRADAGREQSNNRSKSGAKQRRTSGSARQSYGANLIPDARSSHPNDVETSALPTGSDQGSETLSRAVWQRRYGTYRLKDVQFTDSVSPQRSSPPDPAAGTKSRPVKPEKRPIVLPQWLLLVIALVFFTMAMAVNHHENLSTQYGSTRVESQ